MREDHEPLFALAGLWRPGEGGPFIDFLTCEPNQTVGAIHPKALPVILARDNLDSWLGETHETACSLARPYCADLMRLLD
jgi:putative SOS response-associated peptidase YedK